MPFSRLITLPLSATIVVRPISNGIGKVCTHGVHSNRANLRRSINSWAPQQQPGLSKSAFLHLVSRQPNAVTVKPFTMQNRLALPLSTRAAPGSVVHCRTKMTCSHKNFASDLKELLQGNKDYAEAMARDNPGFLAKLTIEGQKPPFMLISCSDSRVCEQDIFSAQPGTIFTTRNIANRFNDEDLNSNAVLSFAVEGLKVQHVIVMGHYGCGGVAESMMPPKEPLTRAADIAVQGWINPIRQIYETSSRPEIIAHRAMCKISPMQELPHLHDPGFRALVEENVKSNVFKIARSAVIRDHYAFVSERSGNDRGDTEPVTETFIHGWVYDGENGKVLDLGVSVGPPGGRSP